jgi:hypothetical protein
MCRYARRIDWKRQENRRWGRSCERMMYRRGYLDKISLLASRTEEVLRIWPHLRIAGNFQEKDQVGGLGKNNQGRPLYRERVSGKDAEQQRWFSGQTKREEDRQRSWMNWGRPSVP